MKIDLKYKRFSNKSYSNCIICLPFRIFYNLEGEESPSQLTFSKDSKVPDYILENIKSFFQAYKIFTEKLLLTSPLEKGNYFDDGAKFIDILIKNIPIQKGLVASELIDNSTYFKEAYLQGKAIKIQIHNNLIKNSATPIHELFHVFQYNYCNFNNMWFMEGLARWSQNITHKRAMIDENLPKDSKEINFLLSRAHDCEFFFRKLLSFTENKTEFIKLFLENCKIEEEKLVKEKNIIWTKELKKSELNNKYILTALLNTIDNSIFKNSEELKSFIDAVNSYIKDEHKENLVLDFKVTNKDDLKRLESIDIIEGNLIIENLDIESLNSFNKLTQVKTLKIINNKNLKEICGFNGLTKIQNIEISNNENLEQIFGFFKFFNDTKRIDGYIKITHNKKLENINFMRGLSFVGSSFYLHHNSLKSLNGLEDLIEVNASLSLSSNQISDLEPLTNLKKVNGMLGLAYNLLLTLKGIDNLIEIGVTKWGNEYRSLAIQGNKDLKDISSLGNIISNTNYCIINLDLKEERFITPRKNSNFYNQSLELISNGQNIDVNTIFPDYKESKKIKILFYDSWHSALSKHSWLEAHFFNFNNKNSLIDYAKKHGIKYIYGQVYTAQKFLYENKKELKKEGFKFIVNNSNVVKLLLNKKSFFEHMIKHNLDNFIPTYYPTIEDVKYPCVTKRVSAANGDSVRICHNKDELIEIKEDEVVNEYIEGKTEYASNIFYKNGQIIEDATYEKTFNNNYYVLNQETKYKMINKRVENPFKDEFISMFKTLVADDEELMCCIDYKIKDNVPKIFEINVRLGYTLARYSEDFKEMMDKYIIECDNE